MDAPSVPKEKIRMPPFTERPYRDSANSRLPREVLGHVFMLGDVPTYPMMKGSRWEPMSVCRFWREVALSNVRLWTKIDAVGGQLFEMTPSSLRAWMERSRPALLDVNFDIVSDDSRGQNAANHADNLFRVLLAHTSRFEKLDITAYPYHLTKVLHLLHRTKNLITLSIYSCEPMRNSGHPSPPNLRHSWSRGKPGLELPSLRDLTLSLTTTESLPLLNCPSLESLHLRSMYVSFVQIRQIALSLPTAAILEMTDLAHSYEVRSDRELAQAWSDREKCEAFGHLKSITLDTASYCSMFGVDVILAGAKDSLVHLVIHFYYTDHLPKRSGLLRSVKTLELHCEREWTGGEDDEMEVLYHKQDICHVLESFPSLSSLELSWYPGGEEREVVFTPFLQALSMHNQDGTTLRCCPSLSRLLLRYVTTEIESLLEVSSARGAKGSGDLRMTLRECYGLPEVDDACYQELVFQLENMVEINLPFTAVLDDR